MGWIGVDEFYAGVRGLSDEAWLKLLRAPQDDQSAIGTSFPTFPPSDIQIGMHGHSNAISINEAWSYYQEVSNYAAFCGKPLQQKKTLLDFGCGWGRILRPFMRDINPANIYGAEPHQGRIIEARSHNPYVNFIQSNYLPRLPLADCTVDYIVAWSVFSHVDEFSTGKWFKEFNRILRPGGIVAVTTQGLGFIDTCEIRREQKAAGELKHAWHEALARSFVDVVASREAYHAGEYLFSATAGQPPQTNSRYGEAIISPAYVKKNLCNGFDFIDHVDDKDRLPQALIVLQKEN